MIDELGEHEAAESVVNCIGEILAEGEVRTKDLGGSNTCSDMGDAVAEKVACS